MGILRGLIGFVFGLVFGGAALVAVTTNVPQIDVAGTSEPAQVEAPVEAADEPVAEEAMPIVEEQQAETQPEAVETQPEAVTAEPDVVEEQSKAVEPDVSAEPDVTTEPDVAMAEPEQPATETTQEAPIEEPETPSIVWQSEQTEDDASNKKFDLPTITTDAPVEEETEVVINESAADTGISVGKKPTSKIPSIEVTPEVEAQVIEKVLADDRALEINATQYEATDRPLLGVILLDIGAKGLSVDKLKKLNAPLTIAILADAPDASERALAYSVAGFEVIAMASDDSDSVLNQAMNAIQIQSALDVIFTNVPNAIGLLDSKQASIQKNRRMAKVIVKGFVDSGHGLVTYAKGLNSVDREARAAGVRATKVARTLDANSENKAIMVRYLDRVSLDAGRDGAAIILGTTAKTTVATIAVWLLSSKGQSVSLAPASAVLLGR
jgi:polysaccharide deacetylase 2 family uncharacterized protein YibQ